MKGKKPLSANTRSAHARRGDNEIKSVQKYTHFLHYARGRSTLAAK